ncbi:sn1-specific diacylglycerol lipase beta isoform X3 [Nomascus leucogenys]|uniref:sn1-specific diacylglycerol lipase beta isoform X3 n=1 Tax=Nomascus leucogenys TaxID=61853 RepID=UPI00122D7C23|nr:sn1-specific diacylglycerol lipase beta isoform X3 [Nomascus leucogenys]
MRRAPPSLRLRLSADNLVAASGGFWSALGELRTGSVLSAGYGTFAMPGMVLFGRRWAIASDDLVFPGFFELVVRVLWWIGILTLYLMHREKLDCAGGALLSSYLIVLMILLAVVICTVSAIMCVSMRGTICNPGPRKSMSKLLYIRLALFFPEMVWASLGAAWVADGVQCDRTVVNGIIATVVVRTQIWCPATLRRASPCFISNRTISGTTKSLPRWSAMPQGAPSCRSRTADYDLVGGDQLNCHFGSILHTTGLQYRDFIHVSFHDKVYELPFLVALDHRKESVVVAVRGTMSLQDVLTDLSAESEVLDVECEVQDRLAHKGISQAARYVYRRLINDGILSQAFSIAPEYRLVIVGHSLGGGAAALLATMLRAAYPQVRCYAFSPPRGLWSKALHEYSQSFIVSLVLGKDVIPRLSVTNLEDLKRRILRVVAHCNKPKYKILLHGLWYELFGGNPNNFPTELDGGDQEVLTQPLLGEQSLLTRWSPACSFSSDSPLDSSPKYPPLYPPGRIIHLQEEGASGRFGCCSAAHYSAKWSHEAEFSKILIGPKMLTDHMPDILMRALDSLVSNRAACVSCPAQGVSRVDVA